MLKFKRSGYGDSNAGPHAPKARILPTELLPYFICAPPGTRTRKLIRHLILSQASLPNFSSRAFISREQGTRTLMDCSRCFLDTSVYQFRQFPMIESSYLSSNQLLDQGRILQPSEGLSIFSINSVC